MPPARAALAAGLFLVVALLAACASRPPAPIEDRSRPGSLRADERYTVLAGDTLYSIAFRYGLDYRRLAAANAIAAPYTIFPGQTLRLEEAEPPRLSTASPPRSAPAPERPKPARTTATATSKSASSVSSPPTVAPAPRAPATVAKPTPATTVGRWRWPVQGRVTRSFNNNLHKGIDISGAEGDPVVATAAGEVVYAGSAIAGYGLMLIVRHNSEYLSAYGHNQQLLVAEGDRVAAGQTIARRGSTGTDTVKLHFEIRRLGRPVDPVKLLPRR